MPTTIDPLTHPFGGRLVRPQRTALPHRASLILRMFLVALLAGVLAVIPTLTAPPAEAAVIGRMLAFGNWQVGAFVSSTGEYVYCLEPGATEPVGPQLTGERADTLPAYASTFPDLTGWTDHVSGTAITGDRVKQMNYVLWRYGHTTDPGTAVVVQIAVWLLRDDPGARAWLDHHLAWVRNHGGGAYVDAAIDMAAEARSETTADPGPTPEALRIQRDDNGGLGEHGAYSGVVHYPAGTTQLQIVGAVFEGGVEHLELTGNEAGSVTWEAAPYASDWVGTHEVSVSGSWQLDREEWPAALRLYHPADAGQQRLGDGIAQETVTYSGEFSVSESTDTQFSPTLSTRVPERFLQVGERFSDTVTLSAAQGSHAWPSRVADDGSTEYAPIIAEGTVYGPFLSPQERSIDVPAEAPIAAQSVLIATEGPGEYAVEADGEIAGTGYYYWVWRMREQSQDSDVQHGKLLPDGYEMADDFGITDEGHVVPSKLRWSTELVDHELDPDRLVLEDRITVEAADGAWLQDRDGEHVPARIRLTVYQSDTLPDRSARTPEEAVEISQVFVDVHEPGEPVDAEPIHLPAATRGWVTIQACLFHEDQPEAWRGYAQEWCDDYGIPEETAKVVVHEQLSVTGAPDGAAMGFLPMLAAGLLIAGSGSAFIGAAMLRQRKRMTPNVQ